MSQEFPIASLDITEDFHILHSAYVYICYSILKAKTYNWHTHTHMTSNNYKQKATGHVTSLANDSDAHFLCEIPTASSNKKRRYNFADIGLVVGTPAGFAPTKEFFEAFALVWQTAQNERLQKTGGTYYQSCMY